MHNHITPQEYLKHFSTNQNSDLIWRFDRQESRWERVPVMRAGQRKDFLPLDEEKRLTKIEQSALGPLNQLRKRSRLSGGDRIAVGKYVAVMIARTERMRSRMADSLSEDIASAKSDPERLALQWNVPMAPMLDYLDRIEESLQDDPFRTKNPLLHQVLELPDVLDYIMEMNWQVFTVDSSERFLTGDNPVFIGKAKGLMPPHGEFLFPLASEVALVGSWQGPKRGLTFMPASSRFIKESNRHVVSRTGRWLYFHEKADWLTRVVQNPSTRIGRESW